MNKANVVNTYNTKEYFSAIKKILSFVITWISLEDIMPREISQTQKDQYCMISRYIQNQRVEWWLPGGEGNEETGQKIQTFSYEVSKFWVSNV